MSKTGFFILAPLSIVLTAGISSIAAASGQSDSPPSPVVPIAAAAPVTESTPNKSSQQLNAPVDLSGVWGPRFVQSLSKDAPMLPKAQKIYDSLDRTDDPLKHCQPPGIPRLDNLAFLLEIVQTPDVVYFLYEYDQHVRRIYMNAAHKPDPIPTWLGHSVGHWDGRTLVVDTIGFKTGTWLDMAGHPHSDALHVIERYTLSKDGQSLKQAVTIIDPKMYSHPWHTVTTVHPRRDDLEILEFICNPKAGGYYMDNGTAGPRLDN